MRSLVSLSLVLGACSIISTAPKTGSELVDEVVGREGTFSSCVEVSRSLTITKDDPDGPPGDVTPGRFGDEDTRAAAAAIAIDPRNQSFDETYESFGNITGEGCMMVVHGPALSGDFAFLWFMDPQGEIGAYAFRKSDKSWTVAEKVQLGWW